MSQYSSSMQSYMASIPIPFTSEGEKRKKKLLYILQQSKRFQEWKAMERESIKEGHIAIEQRIANNKWKMEDKKY